MRHIRTLAIVIVGLPRDRDRDLLQAVSMVTELYATGARKVPASTAT